MREEMFWSVAGKGAFLGKRRVCVSDTPDLNRSLIATGFPYDIRERQANNLDHFGNFLVRAQGIRRCGSAALDICYVACGRFDGYWELSLHPWDVAAAALIVREAGGRVTDFRGDEFPSFRPAVIASNGLIHQAMAEVLALGKT
jgi:myo-inositol-1(or 4)-monophosphatase